MSHNLITYREQYFTAYHQGKVVLSFNIAPVYRIFRKEDTVYLDEHFTIDSLISELQELKAKGVTEIESWGFDDKGGYCYTEYESDESLTKRKEQYEIDLKEQEKAYDSAFSICHLVNIGDFAEVNRELTKLRNAKWMYNLKEY